MRTQHHPHNTQAVHDCITQSDNPGVLRGVYAAHPSVPYESEEIEHVSVRNILEHAPIHAPWEATPESKTTQIVRSLLDSWGIRKKRAALRDDEIGIRALDHSTLSRWKLENKIQSVAPHTSEFISVSRVTDVEGVYREHYRYLQKVRETQREQQIKTDTLLTVEESTQLPRYKLERVRDIIERLKRRPITEYIIRHQNASPTVRSNLLKKLEMMFNSDNEKIILRNKLTPTQCRTFPKNED